MNINYIRAAIQAHTGIRLTLRQTAQYLLEEGLVTKSQHAKLMFPGYVNLFPSESRERQGEITQGSMLMAVDVQLSNPQNVYSKESKQAWKDN